MRNNTLSFSCNYGVNSMYVGKYTTQAALSVGKMAFLEGSLGILCPVWHEFQLATRVFFISKQDCTARLWQFFAVFALPTTLH